MVEQEVARLIAQADVDRVFQRFYRGDPSRGRTSGGGSGLGLAIVMAIVTAHGGRVGVRATPGGGATFVVEVPSTPPPPAPSVGAPVTGSSLAPRAATHSPMYDVTPDRKGQS